MSSAPDDSRDLIANELRAQVADVDATAVQRRLAADALSKHLKRRDAWKRRRVNEPSADAVTSAHLIFDARTQRPLYARTQHGDGRIAETDLRKGVG
jgi:hypothetical protein